MKFYSAFRAEMVKLISRPRTYIGFGAFLALEILILSLLHLPRIHGSVEKIIHRQGLPVGEYFSGLTIAFTILSFTIFFLGSLYLALVAGDIVAKEAEDGTLRMVLCRPISRLTFLGAKVAACMIYTMALIFFIAITALLFGLLDRGWGPLFVFAPAERVLAFYGPWDGLVRYAEAVCILSLTIQSVSAVGFMFSCFPIKPAAASILTLTFFFVDWVLREIPWFESIHEYFLSRHMTVWIQVFSSPMPREDIMSSLIFLFGANITFLAIGTIVFLRRDFKN